MTYVRIVVALQLYTYYHTCLCPYFVIKIKNKNNSFIFTDRIIFIDVCNYDDGSSGTTSGHGTHPNYQI